MNPSQPIPVQPEASRMGATDVLQMYPSPCVGCHEGGVRGGPQVGHTGVLHRWDTQVCMCVCVCDEYLYTVTCSSLVINHPHVSTFPVRDFR